MTMASWLAAIPRNLAVRSRMRSDYIQTPAKIAHAAFCERLRVDRNGSCLSVLRTVEKLPLSDRRFHDRLNKRLQFRLRLTDSVGTSSDGRLILLLPDTPFEGATTVARDVSRLLSKLGLETQIEIASYPDDEPQDDSQAGEGKDIAGDILPDGVYRQPAGLLFAQKCPAWKRALDVVGASIGLVVALPVIAMASLAIVVTSRGGAIFVQEREGLGGKRFRIYKLRTMRNDAEQLKGELRQHSEQDGPAFKMTKDPRVTAVGNFLRKTSIDELPQLWNVIKGDMSLVGPRPLPVDESQNCARWQRQRLLVRPGITCIWQIRGRNVVAFDDWIRMDLRYIRRRSLLYDLFLIASTGPAVVAKKGPR